MTYIGTQDVMANVRQIAEICKREGDCVVIIVRSDGTFSVTDPNPCTDERPADGPDVLAHI